jgi:hypothetical protein
MKDRKCYIMVFVVIIFILCFFLFGQSQIETFRDNPSSSLYVENVRKEKVPHMWYNWYQVNNPSNKNERGVNWRDPEKKRDSHWGFGRTGDWIIQSLKPNGKVQLQKNGGKVVIGQVNRNAVNTNSNLIVGSGGVEIQSKDDDVANIQLVNNKNNTYLNITSSIKSALENLFNRKYGSSIVFAKEGMTLLGNLSGNTRKVNVPGDLHTDNLITKDITSSKMNIQNLQNGNLVVGENRKNTNDSSIVNQPDGIRIDGRKNKVIVNNELKVKRKLCLNNMCLYENDLKKIIDYANRPEKEPPSNYHGKGSSSKKKIMNVFKKKGKGFKF